MSLYTRPDPFRRGVNSSVISERELARPSPSTSHSVALSGQNKLLCDGYGKDAVEVKASHQIISQLTQDTLESFQRTREVVDSFISKVNLLNERLSLIITEDQIDRAKAEDRISLCMKLSDLYFHNATQTLNLCDKQSVNLSDNCKRVVERIFDSRRQQIEIFAAALEVAKTADLVEVELYEKQVSILLTSEKAIFDRMMEVAKFQQGALQAERQHELEVLTEENRHTLEKKKIESNHELKVLEIEAEAYAKELSAQVDVQKVMIGAETQRRKDVLDHKVAMAQKNNEQIGTVADSVVKKLLPWRQLVD